LDERVPELLLFK